MNKPSLLAISTYGGITFENPLVVLCYKYHDGILLTGFYDHSNKVERFIGERLDEDSDFWGDVNAADVELFCGSISLQQIISKSLVDVELPHEVSLSSYVSSMSGQIWKV